MRIIKSSAEISRVFDKGTRISTPAVTLIVFENEEQHGHDGRAAFVAGKKLGNAVWRNRAKRRMRAAFRSLEEPFTGYDVVFLAKRSINNIEYSSLVESLSKAIKKKGLSVR